MSDNQASKRLVKGTIIYIIGNLSSKVLQMLILPLITTSLATSQYGYYDLIITTISLAAPVFTLQMIEGMFRFMFNSSEDDKKMTVSTVTASLLCGTILFAVFIYIINLYIPSFQYPGLVYLNYVSYIIFCYMQKLARCQQKNRQFAVSGVINTIVMLGCQAITLLALKMGVEGLLISNAFSYLVASLYLAFFLNIKQWINLSNVDGKKFRELFNYSFPLIPNSIGWWVVASSDRYVILWFLGTSANGIYSIAGKFSQLLTFMTAVFQLAWQESAIMEKNSEERDAFYTSTFNAYMKLMLGGYLIMLPFIKLIIPLLLAESYMEGWLYNPLFLIAAVFSAFSQFYGSAYLVFNRTSGAMTTTIIVAFINIGIGVGLIRYIGLFAPALGTAVSFGIQWLLRIYHLKDYFKVKIDYRSLIVLLFFVVVITTLYYVDNDGIQIISMLVGTSVFLFINQNFIKLLWARFINKF